RGEWDGPRHHGKKFGGGMIRHSHHPPSFGRPEKHDGRRLHLRGPGQAHRSFKAPLTLDADAAYFVSFLLEKSEEEDENGENNGLGSHASVVLRPQGPSPRSISLGVSSEGFPYVNHDGLSASTATAVQSGTEYFFVAKIAAHREGPDEVFLRLYADGERIDSHEPGVWSVVGRPVDSDFPLEMVRIQTGAEGAFDVDEIRVGSSWEAVTQFREQ
ncbi:MAG: hypothetical protein N2C14_08010, partial [Planctomycetales bacterium]